MSAPGRLLVRADASTSIGSGHVLRCLALAQAWRRAGGTFELATRALPRGLADRVHTEGGTVTELPGGVADDARALAELVQQRHASDVVLDGYALTTEHHRACRAVGARTVVIDDDGILDRYECDLVVNQNVHAAAALYPSRGSACRLLLGVEFVLLREEFLNARPSACLVSGVGRRVLLSFGGSDPACLSERAIEAVQGLACEALLLIGVANPRRVAITTLAEGAPGLSVRVDVREMASSMAWADVAVVAAGTTVWELAFMGVPGLLVTVADNQVGVAAGAAAAGTARSLGHERSLGASDLRRAITALCADPDARQAMRERGRAMIDGRGADRVVAAMLQARA